MLAGSIVQPGGKLADHVIMIRCISVICFLYLSMQEWMSGLQALCNGEVCFKMAGNALLCAMPSHHSVPALQDSDIYIYI